MDKASEKEPDHVFEDRSGVRGRVVVFLLIVLAILGCIWLWSLGQRLLIDPPLPRSPDFQASEHAARPLDALVTLQGNSASPCDRRAEGRKREVLGYLPAADSTALTGMRARCGQLDRVMADAFLLGAPNGTVVPLWENRNLALDELAEELDLPGEGILPVARITASTRTDELAALISPGPALERLASELAELLSREARPELCINLEGHPQLDPVLLRRALSRLKYVMATQAGRPLGLCLIAAPEARFWRDPELVKLLERAVVLGFRSDSSPLASPAPQDWFETAVTEVRALIPAEKLVVALGTFARSWQGQGWPEQLGYAEALSHADRSGAMPVMDAGAGASRLRFLDAERQVNDLWLMDAASMHNQLAVLDPGQAVAVWPLGYEDPAIWRILQADAQGRLAQILLEEKVDLSRQVLTEAGGPAIAAITPARTGRRFVLLDGAGEKIVGQRYDPLPLPWQVERRGLEVQGGLMLAFDGLPEEEDADTVIATLLRHGVKAAFFADLASVLQHDGSARKLAAAGHVLGLRMLPPLPGRAESEVTTRMMLNFEQLYLNALLQKPARLVLLRPGAGPPSFSEDAFLAESGLLERGLIPVRSSFDSPFGPIDPDEFADRILREGEPDLTQVITLDLRVPGKGAITVLPDLLTRLAKDGFRFLSPGLATMTQEPAPAAEAPPTSLGDWLAFRVADFFLNSVTVLFFVMLVVSAVFSLAYIALSLLRHPHGKIDPGFAPPVTVVIPAFNEEKVIAACLESVLRSDYPDLRVIVVDDGSTDRTAEVVRGLVEKHPQVRLLQEENAGKWHAANFALSEIETPILVVADADSIFLPDTVRWLVQPFRDETVGAVAGLVEVGNRQNILSDFQHQEYMVTQNVLRRAQEFFDGILVVPGAAGAWRLKAVREGGSFSGETITEDADLTVAVHRAGYRVRFEERARSITEAPVRVRAFMRQRLRWQLGMLQVSWKHRGVLTSGMPVGFALVDSIWFGPVSLMFAMLDDILLITALTSAYYIFFLREAFPGSTLPTLLFASYFVMTGIEVLRTLTAFWFERRFELKTLMLIPILRFGYRQLLYLTAIRGLFRAATGHPTGWYKIERMGTRLMAANGGGRLEPAKSEVRPGGR